MKESKTERQQRKQLEKDRISCDKAMQAAALAEQYNAENVKKEFSAGLRKWMDENNFNDADMAIALKKCKRTIGNWKDESKDIMPSTAELISACDLIGVDIDKLLGRIDTDRHSHRYISDETGLSIDAISKLAKGKRIIDECDEWLNKISDGEKAIEEKAKKKKPSKKELLADYKALDEIRKNSPASVVYVGGRDAHLKMINLLIMNEDLSCALYEYLFTEMSIKNCTLCNFKYGNETIGMQYLDDVENIMVNDTPISEDMLKQTYINAVQRSLDRIKADMNKHHAVPDASPKKKGSK